MVSEQRMTQDVLRYAHLGQYGPYGQCRACMTNWTSPEPEQHHPGCPCDPANVVVSRDVLGALWAMAAGLDHDCDLQRIHAEVTAALGEETTP